MKDEASSSPVDSSTPVIFGLPLKYVSLVTLALQNALLAIVMHYSRVDTSPSETYSAATAVLMVELLKGAISFAIAFTRIDSQKNYNASAPGASSPSGLSPSARFRRLWREVFRSDCWKLSIPAVLYVIQNNLQYLAASNLEAATFQVTYQMKILTTAGFSVLLLRKSLSSSKWAALLFLAIGVGVVQIGGGGDKPSASTQTIMSPTTGFLAVFAACFTSGLAGVYFEVVLKNSQGDLWVRNLQLSLFSLIPAITPIAVDLIRGRNILNIFHGFGAWAWSTILIQVLGGLLTAMVIKYADNILKCFATSLSIILSCLASVTWFNFPLTPMFVLGSSIVLAATWIYNQSDSPKPKPELPPAPGSPAGSLIPLSRVASTSSVFSMTSSTTSSAYLDSPREKGQHLSAEYIPVSQRDMV